MNIHIEEIEFKENETIKCKNHYNEDIDAIVLYKEWEVKNNWKERWDSKGLNGFMTWDKNKESIKRT
jgi:hypothetical protein